MGHPHFRLLGTVLSLALFLAGGRSAHAQIADGIAAVVNTEVIPFSEVQKHVEDTERVLRDTYQGQDLIDRIKEARLNALRALIERELIIQDFNKQGFFIPENIIEDRLKDTIQTQYEGDRTAFIRTIQANGLSLENYKKELRNQVIVQVMRMHNVQDNVIISPYKIEQYYQENVQQFTLEAQDQVSIIYLRKSLFPETRKDATGNDVSVDPQRKEAEEILFKLDSGANFAELAKSYSEGPKRTEGGNMGWVKRGDLRTEISDAVFKLHPGETSRIISSDDGYYIVRIENSKRAAIQPMSDVRAQIEQLLVQEDRQRLQQQWLDSLRAKAFIKTSF
jgi:parvulin-like peptidyl-prolyl isomerase